MPHTVAGRGRHLQSCLNPLRSSQFLRHRDTIPAGFSHMRARVGALLRSHNVSNFMQDETRGGGLQPQSDRDNTLPNAASPAEQSGDRIGRYKLLQQIGEGGIGVVWMAEQVESVTRRVALKIIKAGMDTKEVIARFEAEHLALARMDHPEVYLARCKTSCHHWFHGIDVDHPPAGIAA
jgi:serine/threonine protein kinase